MAFFPAMNDLHAAEMTLQWKQVRGSFGYIIELQYPDGRTESKRVESNEISWELASGNYSVRVAGLNRFGRPGPFSDWRSFSVEEERDRTINLEESLQDSAEAEDRPVRPPFRTEDVHTYQYFIPGQVQIRRGDWHGWIYPLTMLGIAAYGYTEMQAGTSLANNPLNQNMSVYLGSQISPELGFFLWQRREADRQAHARHQRNQTAAGWGFALIYALHIWDSDFFARSIEFNAGPSGNGVGITYRF